jgi:Holliday junction resolvase RusA-like endonuclease
MDFDLPPPLLIPEQEQLVDNGGRLTFTVDYPPKALQRHIFVARLRAGINPDRRNLLACRQKIVDALNGHALPCFPDDGSKLQIGLIFRVRRPNYHYKNSLRSNAIKAARINARITRGDIDNMVKFVMDAANEIIYTDDRQVTSLVANKIWHEDATSIGSITVAVKVVH